MAAGRAVWFSCPFSRASANRGGDQAGGPEEAQADSGCVVSDAVNAALC